MNILENKKRLICINLILKLEKETEKKYWFYVYNLDYINEQKQIKKLEYIQKIIDKYSICEIEYKK